MIWIVLHGVSWGLLVLHGTFCSIQDFKGMEKESSLAFFLYMQTSEVLWCSLHAFRNIEIWLIYVHHVGLLPVTFFVHWETAGISECEAFSAPCSRRGWIHLDQKIWVYKNNLGPGRWSISGSSMWRFLEINNL